MHSVTLRIGDDDEAFAADILLARWLRSLKFDEQLIGRYLSHKASPSSV